MKIEAKHGPVDKKDSKNVYKSETSVFRTAAREKSPAPPSAPAEGAFAKILAESRRDRRDARLQPPETPAAAGDAPGLEPETDEPPARAAAERRETDEREPRGDSDGGTDGDRSGQNPALAAPRASAAAAETSAPAARAILHVADLERIVAAIRTDNFQQRKQITIELRNSVLKGLEIRLSRTAAGRVRAEFHSSDEGVKAQLRRRRGELGAILGGRAPVVAEVEIL